MSEARDHLIEIQKYCADSRICYVDHIWNCRYHDAPKSTGAWPFRRASDESNIVKFPNGSHWHLGDGVWHP